MLPRAARRLSPRSTKVSVLLSRGWPSSKNRDAGPRPKRPALLSCHGEDHGEARDPEGYVNG